MLINTGTASSQILSFWGEIYQTQFFIGHLIGHYNNIMYSVWVNEEICSTINWPSVILHSVHVLRTGEPDKGVQAILTNISQH